MHVGLHAGMDVGMDVGVDVGTHPGIDVGTNVGMSTWLDRIVASYRCITQFEYLAPWYRSQVSMYHTV